MTQYSTSGSPRGVGAQPWIKMRTDLWDDPRVCRLCDLLHASEATVIGGVYRLWSIADAHSVDGRLSGMTPATLDRKAGVPGLADALVVVGWLIVDGDYVVVPDFGIHNGRSAKKRAQAALRNQAKRTRDTAVTLPLRPERNESVTREDEIREEQNKEDKTQESAPVVIPTKLSDMIDAWNALPGSIAPRIFKRDSREILRAWRRASKDPEAGPLLNEPDAVMSAIRESSYLHGQSWFRFPWLLKQDSARVTWNIVKVMDGRYRSGPTKAERARRQTMTALEDFANDD